MLPSASCCLLDTLSLTDTSDTTKHTRRHLRGQLAACACVCWWRQAFACRRVHWRFFAATAILLTMLSRCDKETMPLTDQMIVAPYDFFQSKVLGLKRLSVVHCKRVRIAASTKVLLSRPRIIIFQSNQINFPLRIFAKKATNFLKIEI